MTNLDVKFESFFLNCDLNTKAATGIASPFFSLN